MWVRWARLSIVHKIGGLFLKVWHFWHRKKFGTCQKFGMTGKKVPKVPLTTPRPPPPFPFPCPFPLSLPPLSLPPLSLPPCAVPYAFPCPLVCTSSLPFFLVQSLPLYLPLTLPLSVCYNQLIWVIFTCNVTFSQK